MTFLDFDWGDIHQQLALIDLKWSKGDGSYHFLTFIIIYEYSIAVINTLLCYVKAFVYTSIVINFDCFVQQVLIANLSWIN